MAAIPAITAQASLLAHFSLPGERSAGPSPGAGFGELLKHGLEATEAKIGKADALIEAFASGDAVPLHQVVIALEDAKIAVDFAAQVRTRLLEAYRDFMNMQL